MAYPPAYTRAYSFTDWETLHPADPKPGPQLDAEYDGVSNALTATQTAIALIQRADGALANDSVGEDQLQDGIFDGIADGITADAEAAAAAAQASALAAATSASQSSASAASALTSSNNAAGAAAQAGVSQGIAQSASADAQQFRDDADDAADAATVAANEAQGSFNATQAAVQRSFEWAELLTGPVLPAPPGWPEAVDDGMFSSKWWAIRARDYNATTTIDLGTAGTDVGNAFDIWDAIPGNDLGVGQTYATWGSPTQTYVLIDRSNPSDPASWQNITGGPGPPGPPNVLDIGTVTTGPPGSAALADITGTSPNQILSLTIPRGDVGATGGPGPVGPPNALSIGTVTTVPDGTPSSATITGTAPTQVLNLTLTAGPQGIQGIQGIQGPAGPAVNLANPTGTIGLVAVNGVAGTAPRSDSSPALSQAIAPSWTGLHTFTSTAGGAGSAINITSSQPTILFNETDQTANNQLWFQQMQNGHFLIGVLDNPITSSRNALDIARNAAGITSISFGNITDNPNFIYVGTGTSSHNGNSVWGSTTRRFLIGGANGAIVSRYDDNGLNMAMTTMNGGITAASQGWGWQNQFGQDGTNFFPAGQIQWRALDNYGSAAARVSSFHIFTTSNGVDAEVIHFKTAGIVTSTSLSVVYNSTPLIVRNSGTSTPQTAIFNSDHANGPYLTFQRSGVAFAWIGNASPSLVNVSYQLDGFSIGTAGPTPIIFSHNSGIESARFGQTGSLMITGAYSGGTGAPLAPSIEIGMGNSVMATLLAYNRGTSTYLAMQLNASYVELSGPGAAEFRMQGHVAIQDLQDGLLRINNAGSYPSGVYTPGVIRADGNFVTDARLTNVAGDKFIRLNTGQFTYGSVYCNGAAGAYHGYVINDAGPLCSLLSNGTNCGVFNQSDGAWLMQRSSTTAASTGYNFSAPSFTSTSSRAIKRETGRPSRAADVLARLRPLFYRLLDGDDHEQLGLIAEEVHEVCPQLSDGKTVAYDRLALLLLADWQESRAA